MDASAGGGENPALQNPFTNLPRFSQRVALTIAGLYMAGILVPELAPVLSLVPGNTLWAGHVWNIFTAPFFEVSIISVIFNGLAAALFGKFLEPVWGSKEVCRFVLFVAWTSSLLSFLLMLAMFALTGDVGYLMVDMQGFLGVVGAYSIAFKQLMPEQSLKMFFFFTVRAKNIPGVFFLIFLFFSLLGASAKDFPLILFGMLVGFWYLRFLQKKANGHIGDISDAFSFASFFPAPIRLPFAYLGTACYSVARILCMCCCVRHSSREYSLAGAGAGGGAGGGAAGGHTLAGSSSTSGGGLGSLFAPRPTQQPSESDVEARRQRAVEAFERRMEQQQQQQQGSEQNV